MTAMAQGPSGLGAAIEKFGEWITHLMWPSSLATYQLAETGAWVLALISIITLGILYYRSTEQGMGRAFYAPRSFHFLHGPLWGPLALGATAALLIVTLPYYREGGRAFIPASWPSWFSLRYQAAYRIVAVATVLLLLGLAVVLRRCFREAAPETPEAKGRLAARSEIVIQPKNIYSIPVVVSWTGTSDYWGWPSYPQSELGRVLIRFAPKVLSGGFTCIAPSATTNWEHVLITGQTGSGKGMATFNVVMASAKIPFLYQDIKSELPCMERLWEMTGEEPIRFGRAADGGWPSMRWNPLEEVLSSDEPEDDVSALVGCLMPSDRGAADFVKAAARPLLTHCLLSRKFKVLANLRAAIRDRGLTQVLTEIDTPQGYMVALQGKNMTEYVTDAFMTALVPYSVGWGRRVSSASDFTLDDLFRRGGYVLSAEPDKSLALPLVVFWQMAFRKMLRATKPLRLLLLMDEALAAGPIPGADDGLVTLRSRQVSIFYGVQNLAGLRDVYGGGDKGQKVINSFNNKIWLLHALNDQDRDTLINSLGNRAVRKKQGSGQVWSTAPLLTKEDLYRRGRGEGEFWAVYQFTGVSRPSAPIVGRVVPTTGQQVRPPSPEELAEALERFGQAAEPGLMTAEEQTELGEAKASAARASLTAQASSVAQQAEPRLTHTSVEVEEWV